MTPKHARRLEMYRQGLSDREIAEAEGVPRQIITDWRWYRKLPNNGIRFTDARCCHMRTVLTDDQREVVLGFFARLLREDDCRKRRRAAG